MNIKHIAFTILALPLAVVAHTTLETKAPEQPAHEQAKPQETAKPELAKVEHPAAKAEATSKPKAKFHNKRSRKSKDDFVKELEQHRTQSQREADQNTDTETKLIIDNALTCFDRWVNTIKSYESERVSYWRSAKNAESELKLIRQITHKHKKPQAQSYDAKVVEQLKTRFEDVKKKVNDVTFGSDNKKAADTMVQCLESYLQLIETLKDKKVNFKVLQKKVFKDLQGLELFAFAKHNK
jgi:hypothetical protein